VTENLGVPTWQERIGGRWAISIQSYAIGAVLNIAILALTGGQIGADEVHAKDIGAWALVGIAAALIVGAYALAADASIFKYRRERAVPAWLAITFHLGVGLIFGLVIVVAGDHWIEPSTQDPVVRVACICLIGLWWGLTSSLVLEARDRFNGQREALIERAVDLELATISETETAMRLRSAIAQEAGPALDGTRRQVNHVLDGFASQTQALLPVEEWWKISQSLRTTADSAIRPLSHHLWEATERQYPRPRLDRVLTRLFLYQRFAVMPTMAILAIGYLPAGVFRFGGFGGFLATALMTLGAGLLLLVANLAMGSTRRLHALVFIAALIATQLYECGYLAALSWRTGDSLSPGPEIAGGMIAVGVSVLLPAAYSSLNSIRSEILERFRLDTDDARIRQLANARQLAHVTRQAARDLHGSVQTRLISCAVAIEQASRSGDIAQFRHALETSIAILDSPLPDHADDPSASIREEVHRMCAPWEGLCSFTWEIEPELGQIRGPLAIAAGRIVEEAVANACRHGLAESVRIQVRRIDGPAISFRIDDDGAGPSGGQPGLGTAMLAGISRGQVELSARPEGGSRLCVILPID